MRETTIHQGILDNLGAGIYFVDPNWQVQFWNKKAEEITGFSKQEVLGQLFTELPIKRLSADGSPFNQFNCPMVGTFKDGKPREAKSIMYTRAGQEFPIYIRTTPLHDDNGKFLGGIALFQKFISGHDSMGDLKSLRFAATHDFLTEVGNRIKIETSLDQNIQLYKNAGTNFGVFFLDIDFFKQVNDASGHIVGDIVLKQIAQCLISSSREGDVIGRWGGDEFIIILPQVTEDILQKISERLISRIKQIRITGKNYDIQVTISAGVTMVKEDDTALSILERADQLLYQAKHSGRDQFQMSF